MKLGGYSPLICTPLLITPRDTLHCRHLEPNYCLDVAEERAPFRYRNTINRFRVSTVVRSYFSLYV